MENNHYFIYMIELQNEKYFLHLTNLNDEQQIMKESEFMYDFVKNNPPIKITNQIECYDVAELDYYVKQNMQKYGIEYVRGGSYSMEIIPEHLRTCLEFEFTNYMKPLENQKILKDIYIKYNYDFLQNKQSLQNEIIRLEKQLFEYNKTKEILKNIDMKRDFIKDIEWFSEYCNYLEATIYIGKIDKTKTSKETFDKNTEFINNCKKVYTIFEKHMEKPIYYEPVFYLQNPHCLLDTIFYHNHDIASVNIFVEIKKYLDVIEYMTYYIKNRTDEYEFDLSTFPNNFPKIVEYSIQYLYLYFYQ